MKKRFVFLIALMAIFSYSTIAQIKQDCSGNVGINCTPSYKFYVNGNSRFQGNVGISCAPSSYKFDVNGTSHFHTQLVDFYVNNDYLKLDHYYAENDFFFAACDYEPTIRPEYDMVGFLGTYDLYLFRVYSSEVYCDDLIESSDGRLKENIRDIESPLPKLQQVRGIKYDRIENDISHFSIAKQNEINRIRKDKFGFIAQELMEIYPELVEYEDSSDLYGINYIGMIPILVEAIKEQQIMIENLNNEIFALKSESSGNLKSELLTADDNLSEQADKPLLFQNEPNPFNEDTKIKFYIPEGFSEAKLYI